MAQKPLYEAVSKKLIADHWQGPGSPRICCAPIDLDTKKNTIQKVYPWLNEGPLVVKVDELFGKRAKLGYVKVAKNFADAWEWMSNLRGKEVTVGHHRGYLHHFLIEPFIPHTHEYYLALTCCNEQDMILFSEKGGVDIEEQGHSLKKIPIALEEVPDLSPLPKTLHSTIYGLLALFRTLDLAFLEVNPLTEVQGTTYLLDTVCRVDSCAAHRQKGTWGTMELPEGFGLTLTPEERMIHSLDAQSGSSLKFVLLNPKGHIWTMVAGGGASMIYADAITSHAPTEELANYGEWSGNPTTDEMEAYTSSILRVLTQNPGKNVLIIGGGIANFTDIAKTFEGIIRALQHFSTKLHNTHIFVRRAGPNDEQGRSALQKACDAMDIPCVTFGAELPMTDIVQMAIANLGLRGGASKKMPLCRCGGSTPLTMTHQPCPNIP